MFKIYKISQKKGFLIEQCTNWKFRTKAFKSFVQVCVCGGGAFSL